MELWNSPEILSKFASISAATAYLFGLISALSFVIYWAADTRLTQLRPTATLQEVKRVENRIMTIAGHLAARITWTALDVTPLGDQATGGELDSEVAVELQQTPAWAEPGSALMVLHRLNSYRVQMINAFEAIFECDLGVVNGAYPFSQQVSDLTGLGYIRILIPLKQFLAGHSHYQVTLTNAEFTMTINGRTVKRTFQASAPTMPKQIYTNSIVGYIDQNFPLPKLTEFSR